ncbi:phosphatidate cytidylyltransferase [Roseateles sp.]|uniref:phosphatidate cytidylyltransferase n=1 Tax=Roseateles sp. TaxID=1971397 RepID=UPI00393AADDC
MLKTRILTAVVLLAVLLPEIFAASPWPFAWVTVLMMAAAGWEWCRLNGLPGAGALAGGGLLGGACVVTLLSLGITAPPPAVWWLAGGAWVLGGAWALRQGPAGWPRIAPALRIALGAVLLWGAWIAIVQAKAVGTNFLLSIFCLVWMADIAAYAGGRAFGKRKLAPGISPGKSWEGVWTGMVGVLVLGFVWVHLIDVHLPVDSASLYTRLVRQLGATSLLAVVFLTAMSVVGDLFESLIKRAAGAKDSSGLLPGHGGVLDRIDALLPVFPLALALASLA